MEENRHIFNNLTQVEKIKPKIDNPIIVEDVTYNFSDFIENEWISHFPQYSHRMRSNFVKGAEIVDKHIANVNQCLIQLEDELYRVYDKLSDDKKAEVAKFIQARQDEVNTFIQARKDEVASFISNRKTEVADFIKDRKNEVSTFISDKQNLVDEFVKARKNEVADFIKSKTNEVSDYISQKENQITRFITTKDSEIKKRTDTLDSYTKDLEGKIDQFNRVLQGGEATDNKLGLITLNKIREVSPKVVIEVATYNDLKNNLTGQEYKEIFKRLALDKKIAMDYIKDPKQRKKAFEAHDFMEIVAPVIALDIIQNPDIYNDLLDSTVGKKDFFENDDILKQIKDNSLDDMFKNPKVLEATLMVPNFMEDVRPRFGNKILSLFATDETIRNNIRYAKELQKYVKLYNQSNMLSLLKKIDFKQEDSPEKLNNVLKDNMVGLVTLGVYNGKNPLTKCTMYNKEHKEIVVGNIDSLYYHRDEAYTINNCNAIAFKGYTFEEINDGYACMVVYELKGE